MKKILMAMVFVLPLFLMNNVQAQNDDGYHLSGFITAEDVCPVGGTVYAYIGSLGETHFGYTGPGSYTLYWGQIFTGPEACDVWCITTTLQGGIYCYDEQTIVVPYQYFNLHLNPIEGPVPGDDSNPGQ